MDDRTYWIYALVDPRDGEIRYVGWSYRPEYRLGQHRSFEVAESYKENWIQQLWDSNLEPLLVLLQEYESLDQWESAEKFWINKLRSEGCRLTNIAEGGGGGGHYTPHTAETKKKMSESAKARYKRSGERERMRTIQKKSMEDPIRYAQAVSDLAAAQGSPVHKASLSAARRLLWEDPEYQAKMSKMSSETWQDPEIREQRLSGLEKSRNCEKRIEAARKGVRDPEVQRRRIATMRENKRLRKEALKQA